MVMVTANVTQSIDNQTPFKELFTVRISDIRGRKKIVTDQQEFQHELARAACAMSSAALYKVTRPHRSSEQVLQPNSEVC